MVETVVAEPRIFRQRVGAETRLEESAPGSLLAESREHSQDAVNHAARDLSIVVAIRLVSRHRGDVCSIGHQERRD